ncbi:MAG: DDE-type integrase/transposase/recombinase [Oligoflexia bacterium]|nr:DDE-type integrase/transposase/recombinase [Oligoflexia bacterium]
MEAALKYRSYPNVVKKEVARARNVYLFPDMKIPRTTAQYWVKTQRQTDTTNVIEFESVYRKKSEFLENELAKEKSMRRLLETVRKVFPFDFRTKQLRSKQSRAQIVAAIQESLKHNKLSHCLEAIGLTKSSYRRWASEISLCNNTKSPCERRKASQLTEDEISSMKKIVTAKKYAHISIASLHLLAQRTGELFCSVDTWYKYFRVFEWCRPWRLEKKEFKKTGIRATKPNEIWHVDVTEVAIAPNVKFYIQAIIDNFSRYVLAWRVTNEITAQETVETLKLARQKSRELLGTDISSDVMMDPGKENNNGKVIQFITSNRLRRILAQVDVHFSNSMIEGLFHSLKNRFLYHQKIKSGEDLLRKANFYFRQHNDVVPLAVHKGGVPIEIFKSQWDDPERTKLQENKKSAFLARKAKNKQPPCASCPSLN